MRDVRSLARCSARTARCKALMLDVHCAAPRRAARCDVRCTNALHRCALSRARKNRAHATRLISDATRAIAQGLFVGCERLAQPVQLSAVTLSTEHEANAH